MLLSIPLLLLMTPPSSQHPANTFLLMPPTSLQDTESELVTPVSRGARTEGCCSEDHLLVCQHIDIKPELLIRKREIKILGISFSFSNYIEPHGFVYKTQGGDEAVITHNEGSGNMFGSVKTREGKSFAIEKCEGGHVIKEYDVESFPEEDEGIRKRADSENYTDSVSKCIMASGIPSKEDASILTPQPRQAQDHQDTKTVVEYTVMLYYTSEVRKYVVDLEGFFDQILAETNQGAAL